MFDAIAMAQLISATMYNDIDKMKGNLEEYGLGKMNYNRLRETAIVTFDNGQRFLITVEEMQRD